MLALHLLLGHAAIRAVPCPSRRQGTGSPAPGGQGWPPRWHLAVAVLTSGVDRRCEYGPVANSFGVDETPGAAVLRLSNGGTDVLFDVLTPSPAATWHAPRGNST